MNIICTYNIETYYVSSIWFSDFLFFSQVIDHSIIFEYVPKSQLSDYQSHKLKKFAPFHLRRVSKMLCKYLNFEYLFDLFLTWAVVGHENGNLSNEALILNGIQDNHPIV